jgi:hypothetical protein
MAYKMVAGLFDSIVSALVEQNRQEHERKMAEFEIIANSSERDNYARQLVLDRMLAPMEKAQREIQKAAQHAQWLSEKIEDYHKDHCMTIEQARDVTVDLTRYWILLFSHNRLGVWKGMLKVELNTPDHDAAARLELQKITP